MYSLSAKSGQSDSNIIEFNIIPIRFRRQKHAIRIIYGCGFKIFFPEEKNNASVDFG